LLIKESENRYRVPATGRRNCHGLQATLNVLCPSSLPDAPACNSLTLAAVHHHSSAGATTCLRRCTSSSCRRRTRWFVHCSSTLGILSLRRKLTCCWCAVRTWFRRLRWPTR